MGFVRTYAQAIGLDATRLAAEFRAELGQAPPPRMAEPFEPADPKRVPSRLLAAIALLIALLLASGYAIWRSGTLSGEDPESRARLAAGTMPAQSEAATTVATPAGAPSRRRRTRRAGGRPRGHHRDRAGMAAYLRG